jgi:hypothetical protein
MPGRQYSPDDVARGHAWLGHAGVGVTEVSALHPEYRPGEHDWNLQHKAWPITTYLRDVEDLFAIVRQYAGGRMICYGLNPRPHKLTHPDGRTRSAKERDIVISQNTMIDLDLLGTVTPMRGLQLLYFVESANDYFQGLGLQRQPYVSTGRGLHFLFAYPPINVQDNPSLPGQLRTFKNDFVTALRQDLDRLEAKVDSTQDLRRMVRVYGTSKPSVGLVSTFHGGGRVPDPRIREYLLGLTPTPHPGPSAKPRNLVLTDLMPSWFPPLLEKDRVLSELWNGKGKPAHADTSHSGYDFTIASYLIQAGKTDEDIATVLSLRPMGSAERARKGVDYVYLTVSNARSRRKP